MYEFNDKYVTTVILNITYSKRINGSTLLFHILEKKYFFNCFALRNTMKCVTWLMMNLITTYKDTNYSNRNAKPSLSPLHLLQMQTRALQKNIFFYLRLSSIFTILFSKPKAFENRWKTFCTNLLKVEHIFFRRLLA